MSHRNDSSSRLACNVLIIDDDELLNARIATLIESAGMGALSVTSLSEARAAMAAVNFPVIVLDRNLGDGDGLQLCSEYRRIHRDKHVGILVFSGSESPESERAARTAGADQYLSKRCDDETFLNCVKALFDAGQTANNATRAAPLPANEVARLDALDAYSILDSLDEQTYDDIALLAATICQTPIALVSLVDKDRQWFKARVGLTATETPREHAFCTHALMNPSEVMVIFDAQDDARFADNPLVSGDPYIRFYAGAPIVTQAGYALGTVCAIDNKPRTLNAEQIASLQALSRQVVVLLERRRIEAELKVANDASETIDRELRRREALFREAFENAPIGFALVSINGGWLRVNQALCDIVGLSSMELVRTTFQAITHPDDLAADLGYVEQMLAGRIDTYKMEKRYIHKQGHIVWVQLNVSLARDEHGQPMFFISQIQDIDQRKRLESAQSELSRG